MSEAIILKIQTVAFTDDHTARVIFSEARDRLDERVSTTYAEVSREGAQWFIDRIGKCIRLLPEDM